MKKILSFYSLAFALFISLSVTLQAQTPKLTGAFAAGPSITSGYTEPNLPRLFRSFHSKMVI